MSQALSEKIANKAEQVIVPLIEVEQSPASFSFKKSDSRRNFSARVPINVEALNSKLLKNILY